MEVQKQETDETRTDIISLALAYAGCALFTWVGIWTQSHSIPFDLIGFAIHLGGLR